MHHYKKIDEYPLYVSCKEEKDENPENKANCDSIMAMFLKEIAEVTNPSYFGRVILFAILYRECLNKYGWYKMILKKRNSKQEGSTESIKSEQDFILTPEENEIIKKEYCIENCCEYAPELANEFILSFLPENNTSLPKHDGIDLLINYCGWLLINGYTCLRMIQNKKSKSC